MAISFPRDMPDALRIVGLSFPPAPRIEVTPLRSGKQISKNLGPTLWRGKFTTTALTEQQAGSVRAWYSTLLSEQEFYGYDVFRQYPLLYPDGWGAMTVGGNPFSGSGQIVSVEANNVELNLKLLPVGLILSVGDYLAFNYGSSSRALHRVVTGATANGSGLATVEVRPHIRPGATADAPVALYRATARMIILPDSYDERTDVGNITRISFDAIQTL